MLDTCHVMIVSSESKIWLITTLLAVARTSPIAKLGKLATLATLACITGIEFHYGQRLLRTSSAPTVPRNAVSSIPRSEPEEIPSPMVPATTSKSCQPVHLQPCLALTTKLQKRDSRSLTSPTAIPRLSSSLASQQAMLVSLSLTAVATVTSFRASSDGSYSSGCSWWSTPTDHAQRQT
jgi:hypothetical protein